MNAMSTDRCALTCGANPLNLAHGWIAPSITWTASVSIVVSMSTPESQLLSAL